MKSKWLALAAVTLLTIGGTDAAAADDSSAESPGHWKGNNCWDGQIPPGTGYETGSLGYNVILGYAYVGIQAGINDPNPYGGANNYTDVCASAGVVTVGTPVGPVGGEAVYGYYSDRQYYEGYRPCETGHVTIFESSHGGFHLPCNEP